LRTEYIVRFDVKIKVKCLKCGEEGSEDNISLCADEARLRLNCYKCGNREIY